jgi:D-alanine-D-alanine ligase
VSGRIRIGIIYEDCADRKLLADRVREAEGMAQALQGDRFETQILAVPAVGAPAAPAYFPVDIILPAFIGAGAELPRLYAFAQASGAAGASYGLKSALLSNDRILIRKLLAGERIPQCIFRSFSRSQWEKDKSFYLIEVEITLGYPCRIRSGEGPEEAPPVIAHNREELERTVKAVLEKSGRVLAEEVVKGRTYVAAIGADASGGTAVGELAAGNAAAPVLPEPAEITGAIAGAAHKAAAALDVRGPALLYFVTFDGQSRVLLSDVNLSPPVGQKSLYTELAKLSGVSYTGLITRLVEQGLRGDSCFSSG